MTLTEGWLQGFWEQVGGQPVARSWAQEQGTHYGIHAMANVSRSGLVSLTLCVHTLPWENLLGEDWVPCRPGPSSAAVPVTARKRNTALPTPVGGTPAQPPGLSPLCGLSPPHILSQQRANPSCFPVPHLSQPCAHSPRKHRMMGQVACPQLQLPRPKPRPSGRSQALLSHGSCGCLPSARLQGT